MPDIYINHGGLTASTDDLNSAQTSMVNALNDFIDQIRPHLNNVEGATKEAWDAVQAKVNSTTGRAHEAMAKAVTTLGQIHEAHISADNKGAQIMGA